MISKFKDSEVGKELINDNNDFETLMLKEIKRFKYDVVEKDEKENEVDKILGKQIIIHLQDFFSKSKKNKTYRNMFNKKNKTQRKY